MFDGGRAKGVAGGEQHGFAVGGEEFRQLGDGSRFAGAVDADDEDDRRLLRGEFQGGEGLIRMPDGAVGSLEQLLQRPFDGSPQLRHDDGAAEVVGPQFADDFVRRGDAHIGANEAGLERFELGVVENLAGLEQIAHIGLQQLLGLQQALLEFIE